MGWDQEAGPTQTLAEIAGDTGTSIRGIRIDSATYTIQTMSYEHHEIHGGSAYSAKYVNTTASADNARTAIAFTTEDSTKWTHITIAASASSPAELIVVEAPTIGHAGITSGNTTAALNRDRNSSNTSVILSVETTPAAGYYAQWTEDFMAGATVSAGTTVEHVAFAGGEGPRAVGGGTRGSQEWVLKQNTTYIVYLKNIGANANVHNLHVDWYEHTNKDA